MPTAALAASVSICLGLGMRQLAGLSEAIELLEHNKNKDVELELWLPKKAYTDVAAIAACYGFLKEP
ncbi:hypothetical protein [Bradyrhizobium diazoefficiens]|uniref:hypothetical protein n=1 Tax=Bradyrhizobium diazoefficiens TaxID=1355477 RepID=UPI0027151692|nr:hypothetical protein [Bradyrhizobium diazoefficiens]WLB42717.1 hypothetical protein QIH78_42860 [Bradyrhizobium diazoefficiens]WLC21208.1 hypothetical protein QIH76_01425 [Bradyrhizobium diazoefficiens]